MIGGRLFDPELNFRFRVTAYRKLSQDEVMSVYRRWHAERDKRISLKNKSIMAHTSIGVLDEGPGS